MASYVLTKDIPLFKKHMKKSKFSNLVFAHMVSVNRILYILDQ